MNRDRRGNQDRVQMEMDFGDNFVVKKSKKIIKEAGSPTFGTISKTNAFIISFITALAVNVCFLLFYVANH